MYSVKAKKNASIIAQFILSLLFLASVFMITSPTIQSNVIKDFIVEDTLSPADDKVNVVLLAGQSNATGYSKLKYLTNQLTKDQKTSFLQGVDNVYINYFNNNGASSSHNKFEKVGFGQGANTNTFGPELGLASTLSNAYPSTKTFIIKYTWGGTTLHENWLSPSSKGKTGNLYTAFINFAKANLNYLSEKGYKFNLTALCWMQGESDSCSMQAVHYEENLKNFIFDLRQDLSESLFSSELYFIDAGISNCPQWIAYRQINKAKQNVSMLSPLNVYIDTISKGLKFHTEPRVIVDIYHYDALSEFNLGNLFAEQIINVCNLKNNIKSKDN